MSPVALPWYILVPLAAPFFGVRPARRFLCLFLSIYLTLPLLLLLAFSSSFTHALPFTPELASPQVSLQQQSSSPLAAAPAPVLAPCPATEPNENELQLVSYYSGPSDSTTTIVQYLSPNELRQMARKAKVAIGFLSSLVIFATLNSLAHTLNPKAFVWSTEDLEEIPWIASSHSWVDRQACRWLGLCGAAHVQPGQTRFGHRKTPSLPSDPSSAVEQLEDDAAEEEKDPLAPSWQAAAWSTGPDPSNQWDDSERALRQIPGYVFEYAPLVHLFSGEQFWPGDIAEHLFHVTPTLNYTPIQSQLQHPTLRDLDQLNLWAKNGHVFLTSNDNVEDLPPWLTGDHNIPQSGPSDEESWADWDGRVDGEIPGDTDESRSKWFDVSKPDSQLDSQLDDTECDDNDVDDNQSIADVLANFDPDEFFFGDDDDDDDDLEQELRKRFGGQPVKLEKTGGRSNAPAVLLTVDKGNGVIDAFWFYFYSFNLGPMVLDVRFGNHIGDWEHCLVRFHNGQPKALFFSAHSGGEAYSYEAVEKIGRRPVIYSAKGTHAMYATPGIHSYTLPWGLLHDQTDRGPLWDPVLNIHSYTYDFDGDALRASTASPSAPTEWFYFDGHWGDKFYPLGDSRQYRFAGQYHYVNGPLGPRWKRLGRHKVCQGPDNAPCVIKNFIGDDPRLKTWRA